MKVYFEILIFVLLSLMVSIDDTDAQNRTFCPQIPDGLNRIEDIDWLNSETSTLISVGRSNENQFLKTWLKWDLKNGNLLPAHLPGTEVAIQIAGKLGILESFIDSDDRTQLTLSPRLQSALYVQDGFLFATHIENISNSNELGLLPENLADLEVHWYDENGAVVIAEPLYGEQYEIYHVCLDQLCFENISEVVQDYSPPPAINIQTKELILEANSNIIFYNLITGTITHRIPLDVRLAPNLNLIWFPEDGLIYFLGFDSSGINYLLYRLEIFTEEVIEIASVETTMISPSNWLLDPEAGFIILANPSISVICYAESIGSD